MIYCTKAEVCETNICSLLEYIKLVPFIHLVIYAHYFNTQCQLIYQKFMQQF